MHFPRKGILDEASEAKGDSQDWLGLVKPQAPPPSSGEHVQPARGAQGRREGQARRGRSPAQGPPRPAAQLLFSLGQSSHGPPCPYLPKPGPCSLRRGWSPSQWRQAGWLPAFPSHPAPASQPCIPMAGINLGRSKLTPRLACEPDSSPPHTHLLLLEALSSPPSFSLHSLYPNFFPNS